MPTSILPLGPSPVSRDRKGCSLRSSLCISFSSRLGISQRVRVRRGIFSTLEEEPRPRIPKTLPLNKMLSDLRPCCLH